MEIENEVINLCDEGFKSDTLSDSADSTEDVETLPSLKERILLLHSENKRKISTKCVVSRIHSISDSESEIEAMNEISEEECAAIKLTNSAEEKNITLGSKSDEEYQMGKLKSKPHVLLPVVSSNQVLVKIPKRKKISEKQIPDTGSLEKEKRIRLREERKKEKELAKALKLSEREIQKSKRPEECLKNMKIVIDHNIIFENGSQDVFSVLDENNLKYSIEENPINLSIIWYRTVVNVAMENGQVVKEERDEIENILGLLISNKDFVQMVYASSQKGRGKTNDELTLLERIASIKSLFPGMDITCIVVGLGKYIREMKENANIDSERKKVLKHVSKTVSEEVAIEVQLQAFVNFIFLDSMKEFGDTLFRFTKAIAEAPQRKEKQLQKCLAFSWYADADSSCPVKLAKDGFGCIKLWQQQIQQFHNVGQEVAEAIVSKYPSPRHLMEAYKRCRSTKEAESLLQDIVVRRTYGPLGTQRRIGPELSYKIYLFFNSTNGNQLLQR